MKNASVLPAKKAIWLLKNLFHKVHSISHIPIFKVEAGKKKEGTKRAIFTYIATEIKSDSVKTTFEK